ncbi:MAG: hypothetical protein ACYCX2_11440 [Christensenellales bacterium]
MYGSLPLSGHKEEHGYATIEQTAVFQAGGTTEKRLKTFSSFAAERFFYDIRRVETVMRQASTEIIVKGMSDDVSESIQRHGFCTAGERDPVILERK